MVAATAEDSVAAELVSVSATVSASVELIWAIPMVWATEDLTVDSVTHSWVDTEDSDMILNLLMAIHWASDSVWHTEVSGGGYGGYGGGGEWGSGFKK
ncbi:hypothetical protein BV898_13204 [Hypsibius exemplaris]|uniref:Uncharacterized protein n=1 Tax=Hypsibius exemplaris TaxID=2072580 RepID=A0A1W0WBK8_HYPEX|nr:hypothetical protein BV898_13204 [Hypsibius exemplaris]